MFQIMPTPADFDGHDDTDDTTESDSAFTDALAQARLTAVQTLTRIMQGAWSSANPNDPAPGASLREARLAASHILRLTCRPPPPPPRPRYRPPPPTTPYPTNPDAADMDTINNWDELVAHWKAVDERKLRERQAANAPPNSSPSEPRSPNPETQSPDRSPLTPTVILRSRSPPAPPLKEQP